MAWTCPNCDRRFGAPGQSHMCAPGLTLTEYFAGARPEAEPIFHAINDHLETLDGDLIVDPVNDRKILLKNGPTFAILESMTKWVASSSATPCNTAAAGAAAWVTLHYGRRDIARRGPPCRPRPRVRFWATPFCGAKTPHC
jgi:hypothetical protein